MVQSVNISLMRSTCANLNQAVSIDALWSVGPGFNCRPGDGVLWVRGLSRCFRTVFSSVCLKHNAVSSLSTSADAWITVKFLFKLSRWQSGVKCTNTYSGVELWILRSLINNNSFLVVLVCLLVFTNIQHLRLSQQLFELSPNPVSCYMVTLR
jgi:hypothetical protein